MNLDKLKDQLRRQEGFRQFPYHDTEDILTIGIGRNLVTRGISEEEAFHLLENDIRYAVDDLVKRVPAFPYLNDARQAVLVNMVVNMGIARVLGFARMLAALKQDNYEVAAVEMLDSVWARQVGNRALELAQMMRTGQWG